MEEERLTKEEILGRAASRLVKVGALLTRDQAVAVCGEGWVKAADAVIPEADNPSGELAREGCTFCRGVVKVGDGLYLHALRWIPDEDDSALRFGDFSGYAPEAYTLGW